MQKPIARALAYANTRAVDTYVRSQLWADRGALTCEQDEFPFGYKVGEDMPPMCPSGQFCPDEEDQCLPIMPLQSPCQLNRDGE